MPSTLACRCPRQRRPRVEGAEAATHEPDAFDGVEGLAEETKAALRQPQVQAVSGSRPNESTRRSGRHTQPGLRMRASHRWRRLAEIVPHLANLPPAQFEQGLATLSQVDPPAFQKAMNVLGRTNQIVQAQQQAQQQNAQLARQHFERYSREQDVQFY